MNRSHLPGHLSVLKFSDASDSDSSGEKEDQVNTGSYVYSMRDRREKPKKLIKRKPGRMVNVMLTVVGKKSVIVLKRMCV